MKKKDKKLLKKVEKIEKKMRKMAKNKDFGAKYFIISHIRQNLLNQIGCN